MSEVVALREAKAEPSKVIVSMLRDLLAMAERGEVLGFAGVTQLRGHEIATAHYLDKGSDISALVCGLQRLNLWLLRIGGDDTP